MNTEQYIIKQETVTDVGLRIRAVRLQLQLKQKEMAAALKIAPSYLSEIESGKANPGPEFFLNMVYEFNVNPNYLFLNTGEMFLGPERIMKAEEFTLDQGNVDSIEKLLWLMDKSSFYKNCILAQAARIYIENEEIIKKDMLRNKPPKF